MLDPLMQSKLCLLLALVVLIGVLAGGNPFLPCRSPAAKATEESGAGSPSVGQPVPPTYALSAPAPRLLDPAIRLTGAPAAVPASSARNAAKVVAADECPNVALRADVVQVLHDVMGRPIWVLRDGRALRVDPVTRLLVRVTVDGGDDASKPNDASR